MATPIKPLLATILTPKPSPFLLSPRSLKTSSCSPRTPLRNENILSSKSFKATVSKRLEFPKSPAQYTKSPVQIKVSTCEDSESISNQLKTDQLLLNTPNKKLLQETGGNNNRKSLSILGQGAFGTVFKGFCNGKLVAIKTVKTSKNSSLNKERNSLNLDHENIVKTLDFITSPTKKYSLIVMEYIPNTVELQTVLENCAESLMGMEIAYGLDIARGLNHCHLQNVLHLDLKPKNVLVCDGVCKICDFGNSFCIGKDKQFLHEGTVIYSAPELLLGRQPTTKCDIYSLGIILWQLFTKQIPYSNVDNSETVIYKVVKQQLRPDLINKHLMEDKIEKLLKNCWQEDALKRPSSLEVIQYLENISFKKL